MNSGMCLGAVCSRPPGPEPGDRVGFPVAAVVPARALRRAAAPVPW